MSYELHHGDCLELLKDISKASVDMILCDLPYGTTACKWDSQIDLVALWSQYERVIKDNGAIVLFSQMPFTAQLALSNTKLFRYEWIWLKGNRATGFLNANRMPMKNHENILVFYKKLPTYNPQMRTQNLDGSAFKVDKRYAASLAPRESAIYGKVIKDSDRSTTDKRHPIDVINFSRPEHENHNHPTCKPVKLLEYLINTYTNEGDLVLDNCMGSGSTGVACVNTGRKFIGMELDTKYFEIAKARIKEAACEL